MGDWGRAIGAYMWFMAAIGVVIGIVLGCGGLWLLQWLMTNVSVKFR